MPRVTKLTSTFTSIFDRSATHHQFGRQPSSSASRPSLDAASVEPGGNLPERLPRSHRFGMDAIGAEPSGKIGDPATLGHLSTCDIHLATGTGPFEHSGEAYRMSEILASRGIPHHLDDWGPMGGHDWPYWKHQMREYLAGPRA